MRGLWRWSLGFQQVARPTPLVRQLANITAILRWVGLVVAGIIGVVAPPRASLAFVLLILAVGAYNASFMLATRRAADVAIVRIARLGAIFDQVGCLVFLTIFAGLVWLSRNRERLGGARYAIDPVCGMQVERALAPVTARSAGQTYYLCSDRCRDRFEANQERRDVMSEAIDPVCGMTVDTESAAAKREVGGETYYFCGPGCAKAFDRSPEAFIDASRSA